MPRKAISILCGGRESKKEKHLPRFAEASEGKLNLPTVVGAQLGLQEEDWMYRRRVILFSLR